MKTLSIGRVAERTGLKITAIRFYEEEGLVFPTRNNGGQRQFVRSDIRRLSFITISQNLGFSLGEIRRVLGTLPENRTPDKADWEKLSNQFKRDIDKRIEGLTLLREKLSGCIGCGCLSLENCALYNPGDIAAAKGPGPRHLIKE